MTGETPTVWRLLDSGPLPGPDNMAIDEALLDCFQPGSSQPILRLYGWEPPAFSCGRFQKPAEILDLDQCRTDHIPIVRRITGGGVIYHAAELTYSLVCPTELVPEARSVKTAFFHLTSFLLAFYRTLGLSPGYAVDTATPDQRLGERTTLCFAGLESCDILLNGKKIGGNAQRRLKNVIFQHGSIPLQQMAGHSLPYLTGPAPDILATTTSLVDQGVSVDPADLRTMLAASFRDTFRIDLRPDNLSAREQSRAAELLTNLENI